MATALKLYEATDALDIVRDWISENEEAIIAAGGEMPRELAELVELAEGQFDQKVERVALYIRELLGTSAAIEMEMDRLGRRAKALSNAADGLKGYLKGELERAGVPSVKGTLVTVRIQRNTQPRIVFADYLDPGQLETSDKYRPFIKAITRYDWDRAEIIGYGSLLPPGITIERGTHLRIA